MVNLTAGSSVIGQTVDCIYRIAAGVETTIDSATIEIAGHSYKFNHYNSYMYMIKLLLK